MLDAEADLPHPRSGGPLRAGGRRSLPFARRHVARGWLADERDARSHFQSAKMLERATRTEKNVADNIRDVQAGETALLFANRIEIEQTLGGMLMRAHRRIDDTGADAAGQELRGTGRTVPQNYDIGMVGFEHPGGVLSVSPFVRLGRRSRDVNDVGAQSFGGQLKRNACAMLGSIKRLTSVFPCSAGTFLTSLVPTCLNASAVSRTNESPQQKAHAGLTNPSASSAACR